MMNPNINVSSSYRAGLIEGRVRALSTHAGISACMVISLTALLFSNLEQYGAVARSVSYLALTLATVQCFLLPKDISTKPSAFIVVATGAAVLSIFSSIVTGQYYSAGYSIALIAVLACAHVTAGSLSLHEIYKIALRSFYAMTLSVVIFHWSDLLTGLDVNSDIYWELRFGPFENHPNLTGFIFGSGAMLSLVAMIERGTVRARIAPFLLFVACCLIVLSASARASALALVLSSLTMILISFARFSRSQKLAVIAVLIVGAVTVALTYSTLFSFMWKVLAVDSDTRGFGTNGSGRGELWKQGVSLFLGNRQLLLVGGGLRYASPENIGFFTENSYITILLESGIVFGGALIWSYFNCLTNFIKLYRKSKSLEVAAMAALLLFFLIESFFNRYLLAIGNPGSLLILLICASAGNGVSSRPKKRQKFSPTTKIFWR